MPRGQPQWPLPCQPLSCQPSQRSHWFQWFQSLSQKSQPPFPWQSLGWWRTSVMVGAPGSADAGTAKAARGIAATAPATATRASMRPAADLRVVGNVNPFTLRRTARSPSPRGDSVRLSWAKRVGDRTCRRRRRNATPWSYRRAGDRTPTLCTTRAERSLRDRHSRKTFSLKYYPSRGIPRVRRRGSTGSNAYLLGRNLIRRHVPPLRTPVLSDQMRHESKSRATGLERGPPGERLSTRREVARALPRRSRRAKLGK